MEIKMYGDWEIVAQITLNGNIEIDRYRKDFAIGIERDKIGTWTIVSK
jgi:hypothetical protein